MKILVFGACGTLGSYLVNELKMREYDVYTSDVMNRPGSKYIRCNISNYREVERIFNDQQFDFVYNLAAEFGRANGEDYYENMWKTNVIGLKNILVLQAKHRFKLIHMSSSEVYGDFDGVMKEDVMDKYPIKQTNDYAISKWVNELQIINAQKMYGTDIVRIRPFNAYGPGEYYHPYRSMICKFCYWALHNIPYIVYLNHYRTSTYVTDMVNTLANVIENFKPGEVYNIAGDEYHDIKICSDIILRYLGKDDSLVTYKEAEEFTTKSKRVDCSKAKRDLNHNPKVTLEEGIPKTIEWMKEVYNVK